MRLKTIRITLAGVVFTLITLLFLDITGTLHPWLAWLAKIQLIPAILATNLIVIAALAVITLLFGRIYCSVICPLGIMQDIITWIGGKWKKNRFTYSPAKNTLRYTMLAIFIVSVIAGISAITSLLAPYSSYGRIVTTMAQPVVRICNNLLANIAEHFNSYAFYSVDVWVKGWLTLGISAITFFAIAHFAWYYGRTYCNTVCPVGTFLGLISRFSWFKIHINDDKCVSCGLCARNCKASAIDAKNHKIDYSRCVACGDCIGKCHTKALTYSHRKSNNNTPQNTDNTSANRTNGNADNSRRSFLLSMAMATTAAALAQEKKKVDGGLAMIEDKVSPERHTHITPPGSLSAMNMSRHCTACQLCVSECPNDVLRPSTDLSRLMQPEMSYERGYCRPECTRCGNVCPTGAIMPVGKDIKSAIHIGHAVWIKKNCIPLTDGVECGNCARHCPVGAIMMVPADENDDESVMIPVVNDAKCIGCGACENLCPARPFSAIYVEGNEMHRED